MEKKKNTKTHINRLLQALSEIYENPDNCTPKERMQAIQLSIEVLGKRVPPRRKTDKEKMLIEALSKPKK